MQITQASYALSASRTFNSFERQTTTIERFSPSITEADAPAPRMRTPEQLGPEHSLTDRCDCEQSDADSAAVDLDPQLALLRSIIQKLTGRLIEIFDARHLNLALEPSAGAESQRPNPAANAIARSAPLSTGLRIRNEHEYSESEAVRFRAQGAITTQDGREIRFSVELQMARSYVERSSSEIIWGEVPQLKDPLVINFDGQAAALTADRYAFDLNADGQSQLIPGLRPGRAYLVLDKNNNGRVDDGTELLGALSGDAFADLQELDSDGNGFVDSGDVSFEQLGLWRPQNENGAIASLNSQSIAALATQDLSTEFALKNPDNEQLGQIRSSSFYLRENGAAGTTQRIDMRV